MDPSPPRTAAACSRPSRSLTTPASSAGSTTHSGAGLADHPDYAIVRELGAGGMVVYLVRNRLLDRDDVLKVISPDVVSDPGILDRFLREMRAVARLPTPTSSAPTPRSDGAAAWSSPWSMSRGWTSAGWSNRRVRCPSATCSFVQQAAKALQHAFEEKMVHRDIKPGNLMLTHRKDRAVIKVLDFGLSKATSEQDADEIEFEVATVDSGIGQGLDYVPNEGAYWDVLFRWAADAVREGIQLSSMQALSALISKYVDSVIPPNNQRWRISSRCSWRVRKSTRP